MESRYRLKISLQRNTPKQGGNKSYSVGEATHFKIGDGEIVQNFEGTLSPKVVAFAEQLATRED